MNYSYMEPSGLAALLNQPSIRSSVDFMVVDVRDSDFVGGRIRSAVNIPSSTIIYGSPSQRDHALSDLKHVPVVVVHCMLSQQRGPKCARIIGEHFGGQKDVRVLRGGFQEWGRLYGDDRTLTLDYCAATLAD